MLTTKLLWSLLAAMAVVADPAPGTFELIADQGISQLIMFLGSQNKLYTMDRSNNNPLKVNGKAIWAAEFDLGNRQTRPMTLAKNPFCAGGSSLGDGRFLVVGGQSPETGSAEGRKAIRLLDPRIGTPYWDESSPPLTTNRWYVTVETLTDGSAIIIGGSTALVYVNSWAYDNPTYEFYPSRGAPKKMQLLADTTTLNLYALTWLLPSGKLFIQSGNTASLFDPNAGVETRGFSNVPFSVRVYPGSGASASLPQTPDNNWDLRVFICGGTNSNWSLGQAVTKLKSDNSCISISPDKGEKSWTTEDSMDQGRVMGEFVSLPDGRLFLVNGALSGTAGYSFSGWPVGESLADPPAFEAKYYDPSKPQGQRWSSAGSSTIPRMYHSSATLLPDGSVAIAGSNPNGSYQSKANRKYFSDSRIEYFYPDYFGKPRPKPTGLPTQLKYGGNWFNVALTAADLNGAQPQSVKAVVIRGGFATHGIHMGQRHVQLKTSYTATPDGALTLHVSQIPPNPAIIAPGPALLFIVVNGVPSQGQYITVGDGVIGTQSIAPVQDLPVAGSGSVVPIANGTLPTTPIPPPVTNASNPVPSNVASASIGSVIAPVSSASPVLSSPPASVPPAVSSVPPVVSSVVPPPSSAAPPPVSTTPKPQTTTAAPPPPPPTTTSKAPAPTTTTKAPVPPPPTTTKAAPWSPPPWVWPTAWIPGANGFGAAGYKRAMNAGQ
ncbi:Aldehyde oxidase GLOX [Vanrija pseudolonga]|uniref:Aldehyde oxidase GLOX n=1 Tax=Vanrija pseudolonga TaxID=143232 RepID=A0AAF0Y3U6_9TREE|nr:Aldehyde oxidase GLOX [Vanrija pseudolonga]